MAQRKKRGQSAKRRRDIGLFLVYVYSTLTLADLLARSFYAWIQVRNMGAVEKDELEMAKIYYERKLMKRVVDAWLSKEVNNY